jgi:hypothetical protein
MSEPKSSSEGSHFCIPGEDGVPLVDVTVSFGLVEQ